jgi:hypothetical protein
VRRYERMHGGSGGVPYDGAYPLGLGWNVRLPLLVYSLPTLFVYFDR